MQYNNEMIVYDKAVANNLICFLLFVVATNKKKIVYSSKKLIYSAMLRVGIRKT